MLDTYDDGWKYYADDEASTITVTIDGITLLHEHTKPATISFTNLDGTEQSGWTEALTLTIPTNPCVTNPTYFQYTGSNSNAVLDADGCIEQCPISESNALKRETRAVPIMSYIDDCSGPVGCADSSNFIYTVDDTCLSECPLSNEPTIRKGRSTPDANSDDCKSQVLILQRTKYQYNIDQCWHYE